MTITSKNLTQEAPASPRVRVGGYVILARMADKGRASINDMVGEYHFDCPLDNFLFGFKEVKGDDVKPLLASGSSDSDIAKWLDTHGAAKTPEEVKAWSDTLENAMPYQNPDKKEWFIGKCAEVGINPETSTLFDYLEADDRQTFKK